MHFDAPVMAPFEVVKPEWIDYNGHLNMAYYNVLFDHAVDHAFALIGCGPDYVKARGLSFFTAEAHVRYLRELKPGSMARASVRILERDAKRVRLYQELFHEDGWISATSESLALHIDMAGPKVTPFPDDIAERLSAMHEAHAVLPLPERAGEGIALRRATAG